MFRLFVRCLRTGRPYSFVAREAYARGHHFALRPDDGGQTIVTVEDCKHVEIHHAMPVERSNFGASRYMRGMRWPHPGTFVAQRSYV